MLKQTKKDIPVITWVSQNLDEDQWLRDIQASFIPPSSSSHKKGVDTFKNEPSKMTFKCSHT
jgi:hypothetical protein